jgi:hypothetical protein
MINIMQCVFIALMMLMVISAVALYGHQVGEVHIEDDADHPSQHEDHAVEDVGQDLGHFI